MYIRCICICYLFGKMPIISYKYTLLRKYCHTVVTKRKYNHIPKSLFVQHSPDQIYDFNSEFAWTVLKRIFHEISLRQRIFLLFGSATATEFRMTDEVLHQSLPWIEYKPGTGRYIMIGKPLPSGVAMVVFSRPKSIT